MYQLIYENIIQSQLEEIELDYQVNISMNEIWGDFQNSGNGMDLPVGAVGGVTLKKFPLVCTIQRKDNNTFVLTEVKKYYWEYKSIHKYLVAYVCCDYGLDLGDKGDTAYLCQTQAFNELKESINEQLKSYNLFIQLEPHSSYVLKVAKRNPFYFTHIGINTSSQNVQECIKGCTNQYNLAEYLKKNYLKNLI